MNPGLVGADPARPGPGPKSLHLLVMETLQAQYPGCAGLSGTCAQGGATASGHVVRHWPEWQNQNYLHGGVGHCGKCPAFWASKKQLIQGANVNSKGIHLFPLLGKEDFKTF